ncbi:MAG TPA: FtsX-like permease family protein [Candidatus Saccharibacteria bacterium]|nr:FtsX-like permease family protein [Candidatus Saccharibacteria bacterium]
MRLTDTIRRAGRSLRQAKARTLLTSLAIGVGAFTITLALAAGEGGRQYAGEIISSNTDVRELFVQPKQDNMTDPTKPREFVEGPSMTFGGGFSQQMLSTKDIKTLESIENVTEVVPIYNASALYVTREGQKKFQAGLEPHNSSMRSEVLAGTTDHVGNNQVILPSAFADVLGLPDGEAAIGKTVQVVMENAVTGQRKTYTLQVSAVVKSSVISAIGSTTLQVSRDTVANMYSFAMAGTPMADAYVGAGVRAKDEASVEGVKKAIEDKGFLAQTAEDLMGFLFQFINVLMGILIGFGALAVLTSVFGIINTQYISVLERTQQIGLMKALGMRRRDVGRLFKFEAAWIGFLGGALGSGAALLAGTLANPWISDTLSLGESRLLIFQPWSFAVIIGGLMFVAVVSGILPSRKAAKLDPIEALRTE